MSKFTCVAVIQNQAPYIVEWVAHHLSVGITDFVLCFYGSSDGTAKVTRRLAALGYGAHIKINVENDDPQQSALTQIAKLEEVTQADWIGVMGIDQFINIHEGYGSLKELTARVPKSTSAIALEISRFSTDNSLEMLEGPITQKVTLSDPEHSNETLILARSIEDLSTKKPLKIEPKMAQINRYTREKQDVKGASLVQDTSIQRYASWLGKYQKLLMNDRRLRLAHENGLNRHKDKL